jgi:hypothetical protein
MKSNLVISSAVSPLFFSGLAVTAKPPVAHSQSAFRILRLPFAPLARQKYFAYINSDLSDWW